MAADLFKKDIQDVQDGRKPRSAWLGGSADHFVPIRYERDSATGLLRMGAFNLGGGSNQLQLADASGRKIQAEARLGVVVETSNGPAILCSESFLNNSLDSICRNVVDIAANKGLANWVEFLNGKAPKHSNNPDLVQSYRDYLPNDINQTVLYQAKQKMGDCTCRGQWALLKKEFDRLGIGPQFKQYKNLVEEQKIQRLPQAKVMELANDHKSTFLRPEDVHQICWADHNRLSPDAQKRLKETPRKRGEEWKARIINIPMAHVKEGSIPMSLEALFQGHTKVIIGRQPAQAGVAKGVAYYAISPSDSSVSREHIELSIDSKGGVKGKVLGQNGIWVTYNNGEKRLYTKDQTFEITESVRCIDTEKNPKAHLFQFS